MRALLVLGLCVVVGCGGAAGAAAAVRDTFNTIREVRALVCATKLDPLFGPVERDETPSPSSSAARDASVADASEGGAP